MAKAIYICSRTHPLRSADEDRLRTVCDSLVPDNIRTPPSHRISVDEHTAYAIMNYNPSNLEKGNNLLLGYLYDRSGDWDVPLTPFPDGSYAIFRCNTGCVEAVADPVASRTIWYYFDEEWFIASTSQRAIVMFLGSFEFDERVIPWMFSAGTLGPELSWDRRLVRLQADSSVILDRQSWSISTRRSPVRYIEKSRSDTEHKEILSEAVAKTIGSLRDLGLDHWALPLSGGYDSRAILCWLREAGCISEDFKTFTWGLEGSINEKGSDARIAKEVAGALGVRHRYYHTDISDEPAVRVIDRFLFSVEGRSDHLSAYMDGMKIWSDLSDEGVLGIIKGDQYFGWPPVTSPILARFQVGCQLCSDWSDLAGVMERFGLPDQEFPDDFEQKDESLLAWRDRLYLTYRIPTFVSAMSDIKFSYMEQVSPLLSRMILDRIRELPDRLRLDKGLYKKMVDAVSPALPYADRSATAPLEDILRKNRVADLMRDALQDDFAGTLFDPEFLRWIINGIYRESASSTRPSGGLRKTVRRFTPRFIRKLLRDSGTVKPRLDRNVLAFRVYIIIRMNQILSEDCSRTGKPVAVDR